MCLGFWPCCQRAFLASSGITLLSGSLVNSSAKKTLVRDQDPQVFLLDLSTGFLPVVLPFSFFGLFVHMVDQGKEKKSSIFIHGFKKARKDLKGAEWHRTLLDPRLLGVWRQNKRPRQNWRNKVKKGTKKVRSCYRNHDNRHLVKDMNTNDSKPSLKANSSLFPMSNEGTAWD